MAEPVRTAASTGSHGWVRFSVLLAAWTIAAVFTRWMLQNEATLVANDCWPAAILASAWFTLMPLVVAFIPPNAIGLSGSKKDGAAALRLYGGMTASALVVAAFSGGVVVVVSRWVDDELLALSIGLIGATSVVFSAPVAVRTWLDTKNTRRTVWAVAKVVGNVLKIAAIIGGLVWIRNC